MARIGRPAEQRWPAGEEFCSKRYVLLGPYSEALCPPPQNLTNLFVLDFNSRPLRSVQVVLSRGWGWGVLNSILGKTYFLSMKHFKAPLLVCSLHFLKHFFHSYFFVLHFFWHFFCPFFFILHSLENFFRSCFFFLHFFNTFSYYFSLFCTFFRTFYWPFNSNLLFLALFMTLYLGVFFLQSSVFVHFKKYYVCTFF